MGEGRQCNGMRERGRGAQYTNTVCLPLLFPVQLDGGMEEEEASAAGASSSSSSSSSSSLPLSSPLACLGCLLPPSLSACLPGETLQKPKKKRKESGPRRGLAGRSRKKRVGRRPPLVVVSLWMPRRRRRRRGMPRRRTLEKERERGESLSARRGRPRASIEAREEESWRLPGGRE